MFLWFVIFTLLAVLIRQFLLPNCDASNIYYIEIRFERIVTKWTWFDSGCISTDRMSTSLGCRCSRSSRCSRRHCCRSCCRRWWTGVFSRCCWRRSRWRRHCCRGRRNAAVQRLRQGVEKPVLAAAESVEVVGVDGPDDDTSEAVVEDVLGLDLEAFLVVKAEPLVTIVDVRCYNLLVLNGIYIWYYNYYNVKYNLSNIMTVRPKLRWNSSFLRGSDGGLVVSLLLALYSDNPISLESTVFSVKYCLKIKLKDAADGFATFCTKK